MKSDPPWALFVLFYEAHVLYAYFGGLGADKQATYELVLEQSDSAYLLTAHLGGRQGEAPPRGLQALRGMFRWMAGSRQPRVVYRGPRERRALLMLLQAACAANLAELGQRYCYVLPSVPSRPGSLAALVPGQLRYDGSLPLHPQLWQAGRSLATLPVGRHDQVECGLRGERGFEGLAGGQHPPSHPGP